MEYKIERSWRSIDYPCVVILGYELGHRCGYVGVPENHALYGVRYNEVTHKLAGYWDLIASKRKVSMDCLMDNLGTIPVMMLMLGNENMLQPGYAIGVHGGVTYSASSDGYPISIQDHWWFGYDCGHAGDGKELSVIKDQYIKEIYIKHPIGGEIIRTTEYCFYECIKMADQLRAIDKEYRKRRKLLLRKF